MDEVYQFLELLFGEELERGCYCIMSLSDNIPHFFTTAKKGAEYVNNLKEKLDICVGVCVYDESVMKNNSGSRGREEDVIGLPALKADIDVKSPAKENPNLPKTKEEARQLIDQSVCYQETILVCSGWGYHVYYVFNEVWYFETEQEKADAKHLSQRFVESYRGMARNLGWQVDPVGDLTRLMRIPGVYNTKVKGASKETFIERINSEELFEPEDFENELSEIPDKEKLDSQHNSLDAGNSNPLELPNPETIPPIDFQALQDMFDISPTFKATFEKKRDSYFNKNCKDNSLSTYDISLATQAKRMSWTDVDVMALIQAFRYKHGKQKDVDKSKRLDYLNRTILLAKKGIAEDMASRETEEQANRTSEIKKSGIEPTEEEKEQMLENSKKQIQEELGLYIDKVLKYKTDPPEYSLVFANEKCAHIGVVQKFINQQKFREKLYDACEIYLPTKEKKVWGNISTLFLNLLEYVETDSETREDDAMLEHLRDYIESNLFSDPEEAAEVKRPFCEDGMYYFNFDAFRDYLRTTKDERYSVRNLGSVFSRIGVDKDQKSIYDENGNSKQRVRVHMIDRKKLEGLD